MSDAYAHPHGFTLETDGYGEVIIDVSTQADVGSVRLVTDRKREIVEFSGSEITDVFDVETEDHIDPVAWYYEWIGPLKGA